MVDMIEAENKRAQVPHTIEGYDSKKTIITETMYFFVTWKKK